jgi:hypothetical protein
MKANKNFMIISLRIIQKKFFGYWSMVRRKSAAGVGKEKKSGMRTKENPDIGGAVVEKPKKGEIFLP